MTCSYCATELPPGAMFCGECGRSVTSKPSVSAPAPVLEIVVESCSQCGVPLEANDIFCGECGFVRQAPAARGDTNVLSPLPRVAQVAQAAGQPPVRLDEDTEQTPIVDRSRGDRYILQFSTGESVSVTGSGLLGRNPVAEPGEYFDTLVVISDPGKSVSKTQLEFGQDAGFFWISDRFSGNGTIVREPDLQPRRCDPGKRYRIARGTRVEIGEQFFIVS